MKKILIFSPPWSGHLNVLKTIISYLKDDFQLKFAITGFKNETIDLSSLDADAVMLSKSKLTEMDVALFTLPRVVELIDDCINEIKSFKPDLVIYGYFSIEGCLAAKILNVPYWCSISAMIGPNYYQDYIKLKLDNPINQKALKELKNCYNIDLSHNDFEIASNGFVLPGERMLIWSYEELVPKNFMLNRKNIPYSFIGNLSSQKAIRKSDTNQVPVIYFSLGTVIINFLWDKDLIIRKQLKLFVESLAEQWSDKKIKVIFVSQGKEIIKSYPKNWEVYPRVNQVDVLQKADVFLTHGGSNSFHEAVLQKVPMVVIPFAGDEMLVGEIVQNLGLGVSLEGNKSIELSKAKNFLSEDLAKNIASSVSSILKNKKYKDNYDNLNLTCSSLKNLLNSEFDSEYYGETIR
jgi:MGT family glycosyltransferase